MHLKPKEIVITKEEPFKEDLLNRKQYADILTQIVKHAEGGFTLSINADWGYGKTTFVKMWNIELQKEGYKTIYFNAWESDFVADPMMALIDGLREGFESKDLPQEKLQKLFALWDVIIRIAKEIPVGNVALYGKIAYAFKHGIHSLLENKNKLQEHQSIKKLVVDFREQLAGVAKEISPDKQLIIFVDELDRCRPDYAVQMLERIKHFFTIDNIIFVLSVDKKVLCKSIKAVYGGLEIDTEAYLRRFVDIEFDLPEPNISDFIEAQFENRDIGRYFTNYWDTLSKSYERDDRAQVLQDALYDCFLSHNKSLRDVEKYFNRLEIILNSQSLPHTSCDLVAYLLYLYMFKNNIYECIRKAEIQPQELWAKLYEYIGTVNTDNDNIYREFYGLNLKCLAGYIDYKELKDKYKDMDTYNSYRRGENLEWLPEDYRRWFIHELSARKRILLRDLFSHFELINARFDVESIDA